ncbi:MAG: hypothetical protein H6739_11635 [Alphaproteobacteria bacterium]|nr:hypothetical protein [Alphaproteobacteria bacterium]
MYATAHRVVTAHGETGINGFYHVHGRDFTWPDDPWTLPETNPGQLVGDDVKVQPGGNRVRAYLDVLAPDDTPPVEIEIALTALWLQLAADEMSSLGATGRLPNPLVYRHGRVVLRFGTELSLETGRALQFQELRAVLDPATATWRDRPSAMEAG